MGCGSGAEADRASARAKNSRASWSSRRWLTAAAPHERRAPTPELGRWCRAAPRAVVCGFWNRRKKKNSGGLRRSLGGRWERKNGGGRLGGAAWRRERGGGLATRGVMRPAPARAQRIRAGGGGAARSAQTQGRVGSRRWATVGGCGAKCRNSAVFLII
jgi:hypothetical protein